MTPNIVSVNLAQMAKISPESSDYPGEDMGAILGSIRIVEVNTPEERQARLQKSIRNIRAQIEFQTDLNLTPKEFFAKLDSKHSKPKSE